ncbi:MAG: AMP-binding protein, partial [Myxococcota bacterium]
MTAAPAYASGTSTQPLLGQTIGENFRRAVEKWPDREALVVPHQGYRANYSELWAQVEVIARGLVGLGVEKGDRVVIYMPMIPESVVAMLACARLGAVHSVVFGGFAAHELAIRIDDAQPKVILTASGGKEVNRIIPYLPIVNDAIAQAKHRVNTCVVFQREIIQAALTEGRDHDWHTLVQ